jgi:hypothetical protein
LIPLQTRWKIVTTKNSSICMVNHGKSSGKEKERKKKATHSQEERAREEEKGKGANAKEEERQQAEVTRRVDGTVAQYVEQPSDNAQRKLLEIPRRRGVS